MKTGANICPKHGKVEGYTAVTHAYLQLPELEPDIVFVKVAILCPECYRCLAVGSFHLRLDVVEE